MTHEETAELMNDIMLVRARNKDLTIIIVEHEMSVIHASERCVVLNFAQDCRRHHCRLDAQVQEAYLESHENGTTRNRGCLYSLRQGRRPARRVAQVDQAASPVCLVQRLGKTTLVRSILRLTPARVAASCSTAPTSRGCQRTDHRRRHRLHSRRAQGVSQAHGRGRSTVGAYQERSDKVRARGSMKSCKFFRASPSGARSACRNHVRRRAGDGVDRPRSHVCAEAAVDRRAIAWSIAAPGEGNFNIIRSINERGITVLLVGRTCTRRLRFPTTASCCRRPRRREQDTDRTCTRQDVRDPALITLTSSRTRRTLSASERSIRRAMNAPVPSGWHLCWKCRLRSRPRSVRRRPGAACRPHRRRQRKPAIGFTGHLDTVPSVRSYGPSTRWPPTSKTASFTDGSSDMKAASPRS